LRLDPSFWFDLRDLTIGCVGQTGENRTKMSEGIPAATVAAFNDSTINRLHVVDARKLAHVAYLRRDPLVPELLAIKRVASQLVPSSFFRGSFRR